MGEAIVLEVNGDRRTVETDDDVTLLSVLRNVLGLTGAKYGCGAGQCLSCAVLVDGKVVASCTVPAAEYAGRSITTVEGLAGPDGLHPVQRAFIEESAAQCGFCTPGSRPCGCCVARAWRSADGGRNSIRARRSPLSMRSPSRSPQGGPASGRRGAGDRVTDLPDQLQRYPSLDTWIRVDEDATITLFTGKVELGQGISAALRRIAAEELDLRLDQVRVETADTRHGLDEGLTAGSQSLEQSGRAMRQAAAEARHALLSLAAIELGVPIDELRVIDGAIGLVGAEALTSYWRLLGGKPFGRDATGRIAPKPPGSYRIVGQPHPRAELAEMVTGRYRYVSDLGGPDVLHGRVVRPPHPDARLVSVDVARAQSVPGVLAIVEDGSFLGAVASSEVGAERAAMLLHRSASWEGERSTPPVSGPSADRWLRAQPARSYPIVDGVPLEQAVPPMPSPGTGRTLSARYTRPFLMHGALGPSAALARWQDEKLRVTSHTQGPYLLHSALARALGVPVERVEVRHSVNAGAYGHNGADDAALDAALLAQATEGREVLVRWSRMDEHLWEPYGPAMSIDMQAHLDEAGSVAHWSHEIWSPEHFGRPNHRDFIASRLVGTPHPTPPKAPPTLGFHGPVHRNADPLYDFPSRRVVMHVIDGHPVRVSALRATGAHPNVFALECFIDEVAIAAGRDPLEFRLAHLSDERARSVLTVAADAIGWATEDQRGLGSGVGLAFARYKNVGCYAAVAVEVAVDDRMALIRVPRIVIAADAGQVVDPAGLRGQLEGGSLQALSWTLIEAVEGDDGGIRSVDWESYPVVRFDAVPEIETVLINRPGAPYLGAGEATAGPTSAAIGNAVHAAIGVRMRDLPFTPDRVRAAVAALG